MVLVDLLNIHIRSGVCKFSGKSKKGAAAFTDRQTFMVDDNISNEPPVTFPSVPLQ